MDNYNLIVMNLENMIKSNKGSYLVKFLDDDHHGTKLRIVYDNENLDPNQYTTFVDYFKYDHETTKGLEQIVDRFKKTTKEKKSDGGVRSSESFKVQYAYVDFSAMIFQRKIEKISSQDEVTMSKDIKEPYLSKGELIHLISDIIEQTDNDLDKQATLREVIDDQFEGQVIAFNQKMLKIILLF